MAARQTGWTGGRGLRSEFGFVVWRMIFV